MVIAEERRVEALQTVIDAARRHKLVDENEAKAWEDTGTAPDGMSVTAHDDGYTLERQGEKVDTRPSGAEDTASDGAAPSSPSEPADLGKARAKRRR